MSRLLALRGSLAGVLTAAGLLAAPAAAQAVVFTNPAPITIPLSGPAAPYPSTIVVAGLTGTITDVNITISNFSHTFPNDVGAILVGPGGVLRTFVFDGPSASPAVNLTWTFDDEAATTLPAFGPLVSGTFRPNSFFPLDVFPAPAPPPPYAQALSIFDGTNPNGVWSLYVFDFVGGDAGVIAGGFSLDITVSGGPPPSVVPLPPAVVLAGVGVVGLVAARRRFKLA